MGVDHDGYCGDFGLRTHQVEEVAHGFGTVDQAVVHADIDDIGARFDLGAGHRESFLVIFFADQPRELGRAGDVGALADIDEVGFGNDPKLFQPAQAGHVPPLRQGAGRVVVHDLRQFEDVQGRGAAAAAHQIDQAAPHVFLYVGGEHRGRLVVAAHDVRQTRIGIDRHAEFSVLETMTGSRMPRSAKRVSMAKIAALAFSASKTVSSISRSAPPSIRPRA